MRVSPTSSRRVLTLAIMTLALASVAQGTPRYKILHAFGKGNDGAGGWGGLVLDAEGNLYGAAAGGGGTGCNGSGCGIVFELTHNADGRWQEAVLHRFDGQDGAGPSDTLIFDASGGLYGITTAYTSSVFELIPGPHGWKISVLQAGGGRFALLLDVNGDLYGPLGSGQYGDGAISELVKDDGWTENSLYNFCPKGYPCVDGAEPFGGLTWGPDGSLYGTTKWGGKNGYGEVFQLIPLEDGTWKEILLHSFPAFPTDGQTLYDSVILDKSGNLYGATYAGGGGRHDCGVIFELSPGANGKWKETILYDFPKLSQGCSANDLAFDANGNLWGTSGGSGKYGYGVVFKLAPQASGKWRYQVVHQFNFADGALPASAVIFDKQGNLYGTTVGGGKYGGGVVFEITP